MQKRMFSPKENPFYWSPENHTLLTQNFSRKELHHLFHNFRNIDYFNMLLGYAGDITETTDLFEFLDSKDLDQLRFKKTFLSRTQ
jgi:hypothetical protein